MSRTVSLLKLALCGPGDVAKETEIAKEVINNWNTQHGEARGFWVKHQHWSTDSHPDLSDRPQAGINRQILDDSDIIVAIFWSRFGTPTGVADSGTEEEIRRGMQCEKKVMAYFSDLEPIPADADKAQLARLWSFRQELQSTGLCSKFQSRDQFRRDFTRHLALALNEFKPRGKGIVRSAAPTGQTITGDGNVQVGRDLNFFNRPPVVNKVVERRQGCISSEQACQVQTWIEELAEGTVGLGRQQAFRMWWSRFKNRFRLEKYEELPSDRMLEARKWFEQQRAIQTRGLKTKAPEQWRQTRIGAIKAAMNRLGRSNEAYYPEVAQRLRMQKPFKSLTELTKRDLERVYTLVLRDANGT
ncbi:MAG: hypothetical protein J0L84_10125 [Verrucomicrobia bacterium]|nr:hypothetical protein [Verrucomicrobiota bacterium]